MKADSDGLGGKAQPEAIEEFKTWLRSHGPSVGTTSTYLAAMRTFLREMGGTITRASVRSDQDVERLRHEVLGAIARHGSPINIFRLQRAFIPGLNHYAEFARQTASGVAPAATPQPSLPPALTFDELLAFARANPNRTFSSVAGDTSFTIEIEPQRFTFHVDGLEKPRHETFKYAGVVLERFNATGALKTTAYTKLTQNASYLLGTIWHAVAKKNGIAPTDGANVAEKELLAAPETEREELHKARIGQGKYRKQLLKLRGCCYVTGVEDKEFLRASHILRWADSDNRQRLDPHNGMLLTPHYDALFNDGFISFENDGRIMVSSQLPPSVAAAFNIDANFKGTDLGVATKAYLHRHRTDVFQTP